MGYGNFIRGGQVYEINGLKTPTSWTNELFNDSYHMSLSQRLQGKSSYVDAYERREIYSGNRYFFLKDRQKNERIDLLDKEGDEKHYRCRHSLYSSQVTYQRHDLTAAIHVFLPKVGMREIWTITLLNTSDERKEWSLFSAFDVYDHGVMGGTCRYDEEAKILIKHAFPYHVLYEEKEKVDKEPCYVFMFSDVDPIAYEGSRRRFMGGEEDYVVPYGVEKGKLSSVDGEGEAFVQGLEHRLWLEPGETKKIQLICGIDHEVSEIIAYKNDISQVGVEGIYEEVREHWESLTKTFVLESPDEGLNALVNYWLKKQQILLTRQNRGTRYCPVRNQLQDAMGYSLIEPVKALGFMEDVLKLQRTDGYICQWHLTDGSPPRGLCHLNHTDGPIWLALTLTYILEQLGDIGICKKPISYGDLEYKSRDIPNKEFWIATHIYMACKYMLEQLGDHGLCLVGDGDWNDPINGVGRLGRGESTWSTLALIYSIDSFLDHVDTVGKIEKGDGHVLNEGEIAVLRKGRQQLSQAVITHCWDNDRFVAGFDDQGDPYGGHMFEDPLFLNAQTWAILAGIPSKEQEKVLLEGIDRLETPFGPKLLDTPFGQWNERWGRISVKLAGTTENGSVYCHASMFKAFSDAVRRDGNALYETIRKTLPTNKENPPEINLQVPLFVSNYYYTKEDSPNHGVSSRHYGTGTAAWMYRLVVEELCGLKATYGGLRLEPCLPDEWDKVNCTRIYKKATYSIEIVRQEKNQGEEQEMKKEMGVYVEGKPYSGTFLPHEPGKVYKVTAVL